jgi:3'-phosphoadenosine 5'-phosphosulfate (PAPS) 3'-phosphatase
VCIACFAMGQIVCFWRNLGARALKPTPAFAAKTAAVLAGDCDAALYLPTSAHTTAMWDYAAAATLVREAGGWYGSLDGADLLAERPYTYTGGWVITPPRLRDELLATAAGLTSTRSHASDGPGTGDSAR